VLDRECDCPFKKNVRLEFNPDQGAGAAVGLHKKGALSDGVNLLTDGRARKCTLYKICN
jgi:hypothetical protein